MGSLGCESPLLTNKAGGALHFTASFENKGGQPIDFDVDDATDNYDGQDTIELNYGHNNDNNNNNRIAHRENK